MYIGIKNPLELRKLLYSKGYTLAKFARICNVNVNSLYSVFRSERVSPEIAKVTCENLGMSFDELFILKEKEKIAN